MDVPADGPGGALNQFLIKLGIISEPIPEFGFSTLSVRLAMIQLYILFMITPLFFPLAQVDRSALEAAATSAPTGGGRRGDPAADDAGIVIGSIFIFVLTMGDYGTVATVGGGNPPPSHAHLLEDRRGPVSAGRSVGGAARRRAHDRRLGDHAPRTCGRTCDRDDGNGGGGHRPPAGRRRPARREGAPRLGEVGPRRYFALFLFFLYIPMILMAILSFQGDTGQLTFPFRGPISLDWWRTLWDTISSTRSRTT